MSTPLHATRRSTRAAETPSRRPARTSGAGVRAAAPSRPPRSARGRGALNIVVMTLAMGLFATIAIPSYAFDPIANAQPEFASSDVSALKLSGAQTVQVPAGVVAADASRDVFTATTLEELAAAKAAKAAKEAAAQAAAEAKALRAQLEASYSSYSGPTASDYTSNPPYPNFSLDQVYQVGQQYLGVPYVYGGADPSGFDCSGLVMFVYAQFGISLPHSVTSQSQLGTVISQADAQPGDLVIFGDLSHDGIYAGNGNILHAPYEGASVRVQPIWDSNVFFVRLGI